MWATDDPDPDTIVYELLKMFKCLERFYIYCLQGKNATFKNTKLYFILFLLRIEYEHFEN